MFTMSPADPFPSRDSSLDAGGLPPEWGQTVEIARRAQDGDSAAVNELFERYRERLLRIAQIRLSASLRSQVEASDIVQNTFLVAFRKLSEVELEHPGALVNWLAKIAENQIRDAAKYHNAQKRDPEKVVRIEAMRGTASTSSAGFQVPDGAVSPSEEVADRELREIYDACVEALDEHHREVVLLRDYAGADWDYIAQEIGRPTKEAAQQLHRRAHLKLSQAIARRLDAGD